VFTLAKSNISTLSLNCRSQHPPDPTPTLVHKPKPAPALVSKPEPPAPVAVIAGESKNILFPSLRERFRARKFESLNDYYAWDDILCDELGSQQQAAEWYEWYRVQLADSHRGRQEQVYRIPIQPYMEQNICEMFKKILSNANWETGNPEYGAVMRFLWEVRSQGQDCFFWLGCLNNSLLAVRINTEAFFLQYSNIIAADPGFSKLGRDETIRHMTYLPDYESNAPSVVVPPGPQAFEIDFIPVGQFTRIRHTTK
jgi:hypothetical protein